MLKVGRTALSSTFRQLLRHNEIDPFLPELATRAFQPAIRSIATQCLMDRVASWPVGYRWEWVEKAYGKQRRVQNFETRQIAREDDREALIEAAAADPGAALRRIALSSAIKYYPGTPFAAKLAERLRSDPSASVRSRAEFILKQHV